MLGLLSYYTLGAVLLSGEHNGVAALAFFRRSERHVHERRAVTLSNTSSCNDLSKYQTENDLTRISRDMYEPIDAHDKMQRWIFDTGDWDSFVGDFAAP